VSTARARGLGVASVCRSAGRVTNGRPQSSRPKRRTERSKDMYIGIGTLIIIIIILLIVL
jgi:hypothetical protein